MKNDVKICVDAKVNFFEQYFTIPAEVQDEVDELIRDINGLGEQCDSVTQFENEFVSTGLSDKFNGLIGRCIPKAHKMTKEEKKESRRIGKEILKEADVNIVRDTLKDAVDMGSTYAREEVIHMMKEKRIEEGVDDDYSRATTFMGFVKDLFGGRKR